MCTQIFRSVISRSAICSGPSRRRVTTPVEAASRPFAPYQIGDDYRGGRPPARSVVPDRPTCHAVCGVFGRAEAQSWCAGASPCRCRSRSTELIANAAREPGGDHTKGTSRRAANPVCPPRSKGEYVVQAASQKVVATLGKPSDEQAEDRSVMQLLFEVGLEHRELVQVCQESRAEPRLGHNGDFIALGAHDAFVMILFRILPYVLERTS